MNYSTADPKEVSPAPWRARVMARFFRDDSPARHHHCNHWERKEVRKSERKKDMNKEERKERKKERKKGTKKTETKDRNKQKTKAV